MNKDRITNILARRNSHSDEWYPVFSGTQNLSQEYAAQYLEINAELGWTKYQVVRAN